MKDWYPSDYISISGLQKFENCPFSFHARYVAKMEAPKPERAVLGTLFQELLNAKYTGADTDPLLKKIPAKDRDKAKDMLSKAFSFPDVLAVDEKQYMDIGLVKPIVFVPDLLIKQGVVENKYTNGYYNQSKLRDEKQATMYYMGARKILDVEPEIMYQIFNKKTGDVNLYVTERTPKDIDIFVAWAQRILAQISQCHETDIWDTGTHNFCDFPNTCPLQKKYGRQPVF